jgi:uncharacterized protein YndB with AHSA1/START domain
MSSDIRIVREYPHPRGRVWRALTDPAIMARWGMRPEGFAPIVGTRFKLIGKPNPGWRGYVECQVTEVREPELIAYSWIDNDGARTLHVRYTLDETPSGTRLTVEHLGFTGVSGFLFSKIIMGPGHRKLLGGPFPRALKQMKGEESKKGEET